MNAERKDRWYVRCRDCLAISVVIGNVPAGAVCDLCSAKVRVLGVVEGFTGGFMRTGTIVKPACDARCTSATGPSCDCVCGAENHGTGRIVEIIVRDKIPRIPPSDMAKAQKIAADYRVALDAAMARIAPAGKAEYDDHLKGKQLGQVNYWKAMAYLDLLDRVRAAKKLKTVSGRLKALGRITP